MYIFTSKNGQHSFNQVLLISLMCVFTQNSDSVALVGWTGGCALASVLLFLLCIQRFRFGLTWLDFDLLLCIWFNFRCFIFRSLFGLYCSVCVLVCLPFLFSSNLLYEFYFHAIVLYYTILKFGRWGRALKIG